MRWGSILLGAAGLAVLDAVVSSKVASQSVGGWLEGAGSLAEKIISPTVPAFKTTTTTSSSSSSSSSTTPATTTTPSVQFA